MAEARADALRLSRVEVDLDELVRGMIDLYEPSMNDKGLEVQIRSAGSVKVLADPALLHRVIANLIDNELKHLPASCLVCVSLRADDHMATLIVEDNALASMRRLVVTSSSEASKDAHRGGTGLDLLSLRRLSVSTEAA